MASRRPKHLDSPTGERALEQEYEQKGYSPERARYIYGATVGTVRREQAAAGTKPGEEWIRPYEATSSTGRRYRVRGHYEDIHPHGRGHHAGPCDYACRRGMRAHPHTRGSRRRG